MARIIMAEDDPVVAFLVRSLLEDAGHIVGVLADGIDVTAVARVKKPQLIILDCGLPSKGGLTVLRELRAEGIVPRTPCMILTARASQRDKELAYAAGASDYLTKPFDPDELVVRVDALVGALAKRA